MRSNCRKSPTRPSYREPQYLESRHRSRRSSVSHSPRRYQSLSRDSREGRSRDSRRLGLKHRSRSPSIPRAPRLHQLSSTGSREEEYKIFKKHERQPSLLRSESTKNRAIASAYSGDLNSRPSEYQRPVHRDPKSPTPQASFETVESVQAAQFPRYQHTYLPMIQIQIRQTLSNTICLRSKVIRYTWRRLQAYNILRKKRTPSRN
ncbi:hypothetical protein L218DRAFT_953670 [Marasmius fiardii PR-910]|nr:hypothetical protein L218DRAFT_953670 [Marasmius fiardii PR-910]